MKNYKKNDTFDRIKYMIKEKGGDYKIAKGQYNITNQLL
jgi:hypothetical protein